MPPQKNFFTLTREEAAAGLSVSLRTLDRYLKRGKLRAKKIGGGVFVHAEDLKKLGAKFTKKSGQIRQNKIFAEAETVEVRENLEEKVFRALYEETNKELKQKQEKLEAASFRVGQLEAQVKNSVPLLEYRQKEEELKKKEETIQKENRHFKELYANERIKFLGALIGAAALAIASAVLALFLFL